MANTIKTNYQTELIALRAAEVAGYFTVGSKGYFAGQLVGKRNGQTYGFVLRDSGSAVNSLAKGSGETGTITEREVRLQIDPWHIYVQTNAIEGKTDLDFDREVAEPNGQKLVQGAIKKAVQGDVAKCSTCFIGDDFGVLSKAAAHLSSITSEPLYGFVDPMIEALVTSKGAQFVPAQAPDMYKAGLIGHFHGADYRAQRFFKQLVIADGLEDAMEGATFASFNSTTNKLTITFGASATGSFTIKAGTPFFVEGLVACDTVGDVTAQSYAFVCKTDKAVSGSSASPVTSVEIEVDEVPVTGGTRVIANEDGTDVAWGSVSTSAGVSCPAAGKYFEGIVRANGAYEFETLDEIDVATVDSTKGSVGGVTVFTNKMLDIDNMTNDTRLDLFALNGVVEKRACALVLFKAA